MTKKGFNNKKKKKGSGGTQSTTASSGSNKVVTRTKLSDYKFNVGEARNASEFNQICTYLFQYIKSSKDWGNDIYVALKNDEHVDLDKERPKLASTKEVVQQDGKPIVVEHVTEEDKMVWKIKYAEHSAREKVYKEDKIKVYAFLWNQCSKTMQTKIKAVKDFSSKIEDDPVLLMRTIKDLSMSLIESRFK